ncbi:uncharacterized protein LOC111629749 [Centruroides sculpturatus]|uniref:uncharacterized protein LOC111629749 n=1 Tax=Centruroides sculpturatus TaxID=218467 RepID=UPI000C6DD261|nr:uncharacterized protein LOC111629749 [Centruroides sculpturatus]
MARLQIVDKMIRVGKILRSLTLIDNMEKFSIDKITLSTYDYHPSHQLAPEVYFEEPDDHSMFRIYTDGSKMGEDVGATFVVYSDLGREHHNACFRLSKHCSQAETLAIYISLIHIRRRKVNRHYLHYRIYSDNRVALHRIAKFDSRLKLVHLIHHILRLLENNIRIDFKWIPGHARVLGNETADHLAEQAAKSSVTSTFSYIPVSYQPCQRANLHSLARQLGP